MANDFDDKVVVITGASAGIGAALADELVARGAKVVLAARRGELLAARVARYGAARAEAVVTDVTRRGDVQALLAAALARFGAVDVWVNNAGRGISRPLESITDDDLDAMVRDNVKPALYGMQAVLPHFKARRRGTIVNVSSMLSRVPFAPIRAAYSASKAALNSLTETVRFELGQDYPDVIAAIALPGVVLTDFGNNALHGGPDSRSLPGAQSAEEVARAIADGIAARKLDIYTRPDAAERVLGHLRSRA